MKKLRIGLKLWSTNDYYVKPARELYEKGLYQYIELYTQPNSYSRFAALWKTLNIPFKIHASHFGEGMNLAKKENEQNNLKLASEALCFADKLNADVVVIHPGVAGDTGETIRQLKLIGDKRLLVENKPYYSVDGKYVCNGHSPEEMRRIMDATGFGFCLDFGHAICSANAKKIDPMNYVRRYCEMKPSLFHLTDGDMTSPYDNHLHYGHGDYPLKILFTMIPDDAFVTNEAIKNSRDNLEDFATDMNFLESVL